MPPVDTRLEDGTRLAGGHVLAPAPTVSCSVGTPIVTARALPAAILTGPTSASPRTRGLAGRYLEPSAEVRCVRRVKLRTGSGPLIGLVMLLAVLAGLLGASGPASAGSRGAWPAGRNQAAGPIVPVTSCSSLAQMNVAGVPDAPGQVTSAAVVTDVVYGKPVSFCDVSGFFAPKTHFELKLPTATWHGQYLQEGCEIFCGNSRCSTTRTPASPAPPSITGNSRWAPTMKGTLATPLMVRGPRTACC